MAMTPAVTVAHGPGAAGRSLAPLALAARVAVVLLALPAPAQADPALARDKRCLNCHAIDRKVVGPAFKDVARRYAADPQAAGRLADKIIRGGAGAWGPVPMAANPQVSAAEARLLAAWVLGLK